MPSDPVLGNADSIIFPLLLQIFLILLNAIFASAEIAVISLKDTSLKKMVDSGDKKAKKLQNLLSEPTKFLATIQVGITLAGFLGSAFAAENFAGRITQALSRFSLPISDALLQKLIIIAITLVLSYFTLIFGELVPKRVAMKYPEKASMLFANLIYFLAKVTRPVVAFLNFSTNVILRLFRIDPEDADEKVTEEEIRAMVDAGSIAPEEREMIENIFEFNNKIVSELMVHRSDVDFLWLDDTLEDWETGFLESNHSVLAICDDSFDDITGTLSLKNFYQAKREGITTTKGLLSYITKPAFTAEHVTINALFENMQHQKQHFMFVLDEFGGISGIITINDLLEEIVGDFDVDDLDNPDIIEVDTNKWLVRGKTPLYEIAEITGTELPTAEIDTMSGLIVKELQMVPESADVPPIMYKNLVIQIQEIGNRRVEWAIVEKTVPETEDEDEKGSTEN